MDVNKYSSKVSINFDQKICFAMVVINGKIIDNCYI